MKTNKYVAFSCAALLSASLFVGCASTNSSASSSSVSTSEQTQEVTGGWTNNAVISEVLSKEDQDRFVKAGAQELVPVAVIGRQLVSGMNYAYLCWDGTNWYVQVVYENLEGEVSLGSKKLLDASNISTGAASDGELSGACTALVNRNTSALKPAEPFLALSAACLDANLELLPIALLATQVVSGTNYRFICGSPKETGSDEGTLYVLDVYEDPQGKATITNQAILDINAYVG